jgi:hypothetical protein
LDVRGITPSFLAKKLKAELEATEIKAFNHGGKLVYSDPLVAWEVRQRARIDAQKLLGLYPAEEHRITGDMIPSRSPEEIKSLQEIARRVAGEVRRGKNTRLISKTKGNL